MSGRIADEVLDNAPEDLTLAELLVLTALALDARERDRTARFSDLEALTRRTRLKPGTIKNALGELTRRALIKPGAPAYRGRHQEYIVTELHPHHRVTVQ